MAFIFLIGVFFSSWMGTTLLGVGEWMIKRLPLIKVRDPGQAPFLLFRLPTAM